MEQIAESVVLYSEHFSSSIRKYFMPNNLNMMSYQRQTSYSLYAGPSNYKHSLVSKLLKSNKAMAKVTITGSVKIYVSFSNNYSIEIYQSAQESCADFTLESIQQQPES